jgi:GDP-4-dehydro-6-deoxy-D-mannose reductase
MRILVTGCSGFVGGYLTESLVAAGETIVGLSRHGRWPADLAHLSGRVDLRACDLSDRPRLEALLREVQPARIYHLGGYANVGRSFQESRAAWEGNLTATLILYEAIAAWGGRPRVLFVSSGQIYGDPGPGRPPLDEDAPLRPASPYAASKAAADLASYQQFRATGLEVVRVRPFNHVGPRQTPDYALAHFAKQLAVIERGEQPPLLLVGNLSAGRDLTDVRDMVRAYWLLMEHGRAGEAYNLGSGTVVTMQEVLDRLLAQSTVQVEVQREARLMRSSEAGALRADNGKAFRETGWRPEISLDTTLADTLEYWRKTYGKDEG